LDHIMVRARAATVALVLAAACSHAPAPPQEPQEHWFAERGSESPTWRICLRLGSMLRAECGDNAICATAVTKQFTRPCYAARYHAWRNATPRKPFRPEQLSPCFWNTEHNHPATPEAYAKRTCNTAVETRFEPACIAELREVIQGVCKAGAPDLTGAGP
jgi:hypothetical protein